MKGRQGRTLGATYRIQLRPEFGFAAAGERARFLERLGIETLYLSPILEARTGSPHGYDVTDPTRIREALGGDEGFRSLAREASRAGLALLLDIVPNHMAASGENPWWRDVLESGRFSPHADRFDIDWEGEGRGAARRRLLLPILGDDLGSVLSRGELSLGLDDDGLHIRYFEARFPLAVGSYGIVLGEAVASLGGKDAGKAERALLRLLARVERLGDRESRRKRIAKDPKAAARIAKEKEGIKRALMAARAAHPEIRAALVRIARSASGRKGLALRERLFERVLARQHYRLVFWKRASEEINYRRFFNVSDLVALRIERPAVFEARHATLIRLLREGLVGGVRVDHVDGLIDPAGYLRRLRTRVGASRPILVEKILAADETLPTDWPVDGTTGYEFAAALSGVFVDPAGLDSLRRTWERVTEDGSSFAEVAFRKKRQVAEMHFVGETRALAGRLVAFAEARGEDPPPVDVLEAALRAVLAAFPVYRTYGKGGSLSAGDRRIVKRAVREARRADPSVPRPALRLAERALLLEGKPAARREAEEFLRRFQVLSAPVYAKGVEDSTFYAYAPLAALNEVGGHGSVPKDGAAAFHAAMRKRLREAPLSLSATSTHDTKRGEDVRARLFVLSELAKGWDSILPRWRRLNKVHRTKVGSGEVPTAAEEAFYYQALLGARPSSGGLTTGFRKRIREYVLKAAREAKEGTSWLAPNREHEKALLQFVDRTLRTSGANPFVRDFEIFHAGIARCGAWNGLAQTLVKIAAPGVPDVYQGSELWDLRLVDPDNRRPVDFARRERMFLDLTKRAARDPKALACDLVRRWEDGRIKLWLLARGLAHRRERDALFLRGDHLAMRATPPRERHVLAFARRLAKEWAIAAAPRFTAPFSVNGRPPLGEEVWADAALVLPPGAPEAWEHVVTGERLVATRSGRNRVLVLREVFATFPAALLAPVEDSP